MPLPYCKTRAFELRTARTFGALLGISVGLSLMACAGSPAEHARDRITDDAGATADSPDATSALPGVNEDAGALSSLGVAVLADKVELCAGECANLRVTAHAPHAQLSYRWEQELGDAAEAQVCPTETTTYRVEVSETARMQGEFLEEARTENAQLTVGVRACEPDNPVLCEFRYRHEFLAHGNLFDSDKPWIHQAGIGTPLATSGTGVAISGAFGKHVDLGAGPVTGTANMNGFVHKLDADCKPAWTRSLMATIPTDVLIPLSLASDPKGNLYAASIGGPLLNFDPLVKSWATFATEIVVHKFSPKGDLLLRVSLPTFLGGLVMDIEVDEAERIYLTGMSNAWTDFGGGPLGLSPTTMTTFFLALDAKGKHRQSLGNAMVSGISSAGDRLIYRVGGLGEIDFATLWLGVTPTRSNDTLIKLLRQDTLQEVGSLSPFAENEYQLALRGFPDRTSAVLLHRYDAIEAMERLEVARLSAAGEVTRRTDIFRSHDGLPDLDAGVDAGADAGVEETFASFSAPNVRHMRAHASGSFALAGSYYTPTRLGGFSLDAPPLPEPKPDEPVLFPDANLFVAKVDAQDHVLWARKLEWGAQPGTTGIAITPDGSVWASGGAHVPKNTNDTGPMERDLIIAKLRAAP